MSLVDSLLQERAPLYRSPPGSLFIWDQRHEPFPLVDLSLFRRVSFSAGIAAGLRSYTVLFGAFLLVPFFLERVRHYDPAGTGMISRPVPVALTPTPLAEQALPDRDRR